MVQLVRPKVRINGPLPEEMPWLHNGESNKAAPLWWIPRCWGVKDVRLVNGGWCMLTISGGSTVDVVPPSSSAQGDLVYLAE